MDGRSVIEAWTVSGSGRDLTLKVGVQSLPALAEGETLAIVGLYGANQDSRLLKYVTVAGDYASLGLETYTGMALIKIDAPPAAEPAAEEPAAEEPAAEEPAAEEPAAEEPAAEEPAAEEPAAEEPAAEKPAAEKPAAEKPAAEKPAAEKPAAEKPAAEKPAAEKPAAEKPAAEAPAEAPRYPAQVLYATASDGARIVVSAPEGCLPENSYVTVQIVSSAAAEAAIRAQLDEDTELVDLVVYDIVIHGPDGTEIQPDDYVRVSILGADVEEGDAAAVYHITEVGAVEKMSESSSTSSLSFQTDHFSPYAVTSTSSLQGGSYTITVGESLQLTKPNGLGYAFLWSSSDKSIATVDENGLVRGVAVGSVTITAYHHLKTASFSVTVQAPVVVPGIRLSDSSVSLGAIGETASLTASLTAIDTDNPITWTSSDESVATVSNGVVTAVSAGSAVITASVSPDEDALYGSTFSASAAVTVSFHSYSLYHYALIPGCEADSGNADENWFGLGVSKVLGVNAPDSYAPGTVISRYEIGDAVQKPLYPDLTYGGSTYLYAAPGTEEAGEKGYYTIIPFRIVVSYGANSGQNGYNPVVDSGYTFHLDYTCVLNEEDIYSVNFSVLYPGSAASESLTAYSQRITGGTTLGTIRMPSEADVPGTTTADGLSYRFDGWYTDAAFSSHADFSAAAEDNMTFYGRYVQENARYRVEYYYDNILDDSRTETLGPVQLGEEIGTYTDKTRTGFSFSEARPAVLTVGSDESANVIRVYYNKRLLNYRVLCLLNGSGESVAPAQSGTARYGDELSLTPPAVAGFTPVSDEPVAVTIDSSWQTVRFFYRENVSLTAVSGRFAYDGKPHSAEGYVSSVAALSFAGVSASGSGTDAGRYPVRFSEGAVGSVDSSGSYIVSSVTEGELLIEPAAVTVRAEDKTKAFGDPDPALTAAVSGLFASDSVVYTLSREEGEAPGSYVITPAGERVQGNYALSFEPGTLTVGKASASIVPADAGKIYGDPDPELSASVSALMGGDTLSYTLSRETGEDVGTYTISVAAETDPRYEVSVSTAVFTIRAAEAAILWSGETSFVCDGEAHSPAAGVDPACLRSGDTLGVKLLYKPQGAGDDAYSETVPDAAGAYTAKVAALTGGKAGNYSLPDDEAALTNDFVIAVARIGETYYPTLAAAAAAVQSGETVVMLADTAEGLIPCGGVSFTLDVNGQSVSFGGFAVTAALGLTVVDTADAKGTVYLTASGGTSGFAPGASAAVNLSVEGANIVSDGLLLNCSASGSSAAISSGSITCAGAMNGSRGMGSIHGDGISSVSISGGSFTVAKGQMINTPNASVSISGGYMRAVLEIVRRAKTVSVSGGSLVGGGNSTSGTLELHGTDLKSVSLTGGYFGTDQSKRQKDWLKTLGCGPDEFNGDGHADTLFVIGPVVTVRADSKTKLYGEDDPILTATVIGLPGGVGADAIRYTLHRAAGEDAGSYTITPSGDSRQGDYNVRFETGTLTVAPNGSLGLSAVGFEGEYDAQIHAVRASASVEAGTRISYSLDGGASWTTRVPFLTDVGEATVIVRAENRNYETAETTVTLRVTPKAVTVMANDHSKEYGESDGELSATVTGTLGRDKIVYTLAREAGESIGEYAVTVSGASEQGNYLVSFVPGVFTVAPASVTVTAGRASKVYGEADPVFSAAVSGLKGGDDESAIVYTLSREEGENVGAYAVMPSGAAEQGNYLVSFESGILTIGRAPVTVTAEDKSKTYGDADPALSFAVSGLKNGEDKSVLSCALSRAAGEDVGTYAVTPSGAAEQGNYLVSFVPGAFRIAPAPVTVTAEDKTAVYGEDDMPLTAAVSGLKNGESESVLRYALSRETGSDAGEYAITVSGAAEQSNYEVSFVSGSYTIAPAPVTVTADSLSKIYGEPDGPLSATVSGLVGGGSVIYTLAREAGEDAGSYAVTAAGETAQGNYLVSFVPGTFTIGRAPVTVTADSLSKVYGEADPAFSAAVSGLKNGESERLISYTLSRAAGEDAGTYAVTPSGAAAQGNYEVSFVPGTLTVQKASFRLAAVSAGRSYDGTALVGAFTGEAPEGASIRYSSDGGATWSEDAPALTDAGALSYTLRAEHPNYTVLYSDGILSVRPREVTLTSRDEVKEYDGSALRAAGVSIGNEGFVAGEGVTAEVTGEQTLPGSSLNTFSFAFNEGTRASNYTVTPVYGTLTVTDRTARFGLEVSGADGSAVYDGEIHRVTALAEHVFNINGHDYTVEGLEASGEGCNAGTYPVSVTGTALVRDENGSDVTGQFAVTAKAGTLTIRPRTVTLSSVSAAKVYDGTALTTPNTDGSAVAVLGEGFASGEGVIVTMTGSRTTPGTADNAFSYLFADNTRQGNYEISVSFGTLTVSDRSADERFVITAQAVSGEAVYDASAHSLEGLTTNVFLANAQRYTLEGLSAYAVGIDAGVYPVEVTGTARVLDEKGNDVTGQFTVNALPGTLTVKPREVTLTSATAQKEYDGDALSAPTVIVGGDGFAAGEGADYTVTGSRVVPGSTANTFSYTLWDNSLASNYDIRTEEGLLTVRSREARYEITLEAQSAEATYDGASHRAEGLVSDRFTVGGHVYTIDGLSALREETAAGTYAVALSGTPRVLDESGADVTGEFLLTLLDGSLRIEKRRVTLTSASAEKEYDGEALSSPAVSVGGDGFAEGEGADFNVTGSQTVPGIGSNSFGYTLRPGTDEGNYLISLREGSLTVTGRGAPYALTVEANSAVFLYDGSEHAVEGLKTTHFGVDGHSYHVSGLTAEASAVHAGIVPVRVSGDAVVTDEQGNDVTAQFAVTAREGTLTVLPRSVTLRSASAEAVYTGSPLRAAELTVGGDGFAAGEGADFKVLGTRTVAGSSENVFSYTLREGTLAEDYDIRAEYGVLTVTARPEGARYEITVRAVGDAVLYDAQPHTADTLTAGFGSVSGAEAIPVVADGHAYTIEGLSASRTETAAGSYAVNVTGNPVVLDEDGRDVSGEFMIRTVGAALVIEPRTLILSSASASHAYNGKELRADSVSVSGDGFAEGEGASYLFPAGRTLVGESDNRFTYCFDDGTDAGNYAVTTRFGKLSVASREAKWVLTVTARSAEALYDGTEKSVSGLEAVNVTIDGVRYTVTGLRAAAAGTDAGEYVSSVEGIAVVLDAEGHDVTDQFAVTGVDGLLRILPREVTLTSASASRAYDGSALTAEEVAVSGDGFAEGEGVDYVFSGSRTLVGSVENSFTYTLSGGAKPGNYLITAVPGRLSVTAREARYEITLTAVSDSVRYDGAPHSAEGFVTNAFTVGGRAYTVEGLTASAAGTEAGVYVSQIAGEALVRDGDGNDVTDQFAVTVENGTLTIENTYRLTVRFVDEDGHDVADAFSARYAEGEVFGPIPAPVVDGLVGDYAEVRAPEGGMPAQDIEIAVVYRAQSTELPDPDVSAVEGAYAYTPLIARVDVSGDRPALEELGEPEVPFAAAKGGYWAMANLLLAVSAATLALFPLGRLFAGKGRKRRLLIPFLGILIGAGAVILFLLTEDLSNSMTLFDRWTLPMAALAIAQVAITAMDLRQQSKEDESGPVTD